MRGKAHMRSSRYLSHLLVSFAPSVTVRISFYKEQVRNVVADCFSSWICRAGFLLLVTSLVTHKQSAIDEHADLQNDRPTRMQQCKKHLLGIRKDRNRTVLRLR